MGAWRSRGGRSDRKESKSAVSGQTITSGLALAQSSDMIGVGRRVSTVPAAESRTAKMAGSALIAWQSSHLLRGYLHALSRAQGTELGFAGSPVDLPIAQGQSPEIR
jgi:hypothetical protein